MRGGRQPGAGRPKGSRNKIPLAARERFRAILEAHEPAIVRRLLACTDPRVLLETWRILVHYADGAPRAAISVEHSAPALQEFLERLALRRLSGTEEAVRPPPALALPPAGGPASIVVETRVSEPAEAGNGLSVRDGSEPNQGLSPDGAPRRGTT